MTLDMGQVVRLLPELVERARTDAHQREQHLADALRLLHDAANDPAGVARVVEAAETSWALALPYREPFDAAIAPPAELPTDYTVLAVDGSSIDVDRNLPLACFVINLGWMHICYGGKPAACYGSTVDIQPTSDNLFMRDSDDPSHETMVRGEALSLLRSVREMAEAAECAARFADERPLLALIDGTLALWNVEKRDLPEAVVTMLRDGPRGARQALDSLRELGQEHCLLFGSYVSRTGATNVANTLRLLFCPDRPHVVCRRCPGKGKGERPCDAVGIASDALLMHALLNPWERSAVFLPRRPGAASDTWYREAGHEIGFFYLNTGEEIARVELPLWVAEDDNRLGLLHGLLVRQARDGAGYPLALREAHEQAVISGTDRQAFITLLSQTCEQSGIPWLISAKAWQKRVRAI